jgi:hypothetical protein
MEVSRLDVQIGHLGIGNLDTFVVDGSVNPALHRQAFAGRGR